MIRVNQYNGTKVLITLSSQLSKSNEENIIMYMLHSCAIGQRIDSILLLFSLINISSGRTNMWARCLYTFCMIFLCGLWTEKTTKRISCAQRSLLIDGHSVIRCWNIAFAMEYNIRALNGTCYERRRTMVHTPFNLSWYEKKAYSITFHIVSWNRTSNNSLILNRKKCWKFLKIWPILNT